MCVSVCALVCGRECVYLSVSVRVSVYAFLPSKEKVSAVHQGSSCRSKTRELGPEVRRSGGGAEEAGGVGTGGPCMLAEALGIRTGPWVGGDTRGSNSLMVGVTWRRDSEVSHQGKPRRKAAIRA